MTWLPSSGKAFLKGFSRQSRRLKKFQKQHQLDRRLVSSLNNSRLPSWQQIKHWPKVITGREKKQAQALSALIALCLIVLVVKLFFLFTVAVPKNGGEYTEGLIGSPIFINPILTQSDADRDLSYLIFSGLLKYNSDRQLVPDLAESYEISEDQLTYTFRLRSEVKWHDGEQFKADDVIFTIASIQDPAFKSPLSRSFRGIRAEKVDDLTVKFVLPETYAPFLGLMTFGVLPEHLWYNVPPANADLNELNKKPIGTGAWKFDNFKKDKNGLIRSYTLVRNSHYYGQQPYLNKLIFKFFGDHTSAIEALKSKEVMSIAYLPKEYQNDLKKYKNLNYHLLEQPQYTAVFFNQRKNELLKADYLRQALALAVDKTRIVNEAFGQDAKIIDGPTLPGIESNSDIKKYSYDPQAAVELLEKNGWSLTSTTTPEGLTQQIRKKQSYYLEVVLTTVDQPENVKTAEIIKASWDQIGVKTTLNIVDKSKVISDVVKTRNYEVLLFGESLGSDPDPFPFWHSSQNEYPGLNLAIFSDKESDRLLEEARKTNDWEKRKENYLKFQKIIAEKLPAIFLYNLLYTYPQDQKVKGFSVLSIAVPADRLANLNQWYIKTKRVWR